MRTWELFDKGHTYICSECNEIFPAHKMSLVSAEDNQEELSSHPEFILIDNWTNVIWEHGTLPSVVTGDKVMACPFCGKIHPQGFNKVIEVANL